MKDAGIILVSYGQFEKEFLERITDDVRVVFNLPTTFIVLHTDLAHFFEPSRRQYDANKMLKLLDTVAPLKNSKKLGLFQIDLFIPILTFIFGQALFRGDAGVVSTYRLRNEQYGMQSDKKLLYERFRKVVIHELGHAFGLIHCHVPSCVMRPSTYVEDIDQKNHLFCAKCKSELDKLAVV